LLASPELLIGPAPPPAAGTASRPTLKKVVKLLLLTMCKCSKCGKQKFVVNKKLDLIKELRKKQVASFTAKTRFIFNKERTEKYTGARGNKKKFAL
jgi:hypothetical protein